MDDNRCLNEILSELKKLRQELYDISRQQKELDDIKYTVKNIEKLLERRNWK